VASTHQQQRRVIETLEDLDTIPLGGLEQWALVGQVTGNTLLWEAVVKWAHQQGIAANVKQTICSDSYQRQEQAMALAHQADRCLVVDDGGGASVSLFEVLSAIHDQVYRVRWRDDGSWKASIDPTWLMGAGSVAVVGGILVPQWTIHEVAAYV
jgi:4-hydroxy-3-methylbut-2-en-1-yl diphosphate reductase